MLRNLAACFALLLSGVALAAPQPPAVDARRGLLLDVTSGQAIASRNPHERIERRRSQAHDRVPRFGGAEGQVACPRPNDSGCRSAHGTRAARACSSSRGKPVTVEELLHGLIIQSGNDASIALAEAVAGSEPSSWNA